MVTEIVMKLGNLGSYKGEKTTTREGYEYKLFTGKEDQYLIFNVEGKIVTANPYTRAWCWRNKDKYEKLLSVLS